MFLWAQINVIIGSGSGLVTNRQQPITWTNDDTALFSQCRGQSY